MKIFLHFKLFFLNLFFEKYFLKMKRISVLVLLFLLCNNIFSQSISNVTALQVDNSIKVSYNFLHAGTKLYNVVAYYSTDGGATYDTMKTVTGDIGNDVTGGNGKQIMWDVTSDLEELVGDKIKFKIVANKNKTQFYSISTAFPKDEIAALWKDEAYITTACYGDKWVVIQDKNTDIINQKWKTRTYFPVSELEETYDEDFKITSLEYGGGLWAMVGTKGVDYTSQKWIERSYFPETEVDELRSSDYYVTEIGYGLSKWAVVVSQGTGYTDQIVRVRNYFPETDIKNYWAKSYEITSLQYGNGYWAIAMTLGTDYLTQKYKTSYNYPDIWVDEQIDLGYIVTSVVFGAGYWTVVVSKINQD